MRTPADIRRAARRVVLIPGVALVRPDAAVPWRESVANKTTVVPLTPFRASLAVPLPRPPVRRMVGPATPSALHMEQQEDTFPLLADGAVFRLAKRLAALMALVGTATLACPLLTSRPVARLPRPICLKNLSSLGQKKI